MSSLRQGRMRRSGRLGMTRRDVIICISVLPLLLIFSFVNIMWRSYHTSLRATCAANLMNMSSGLGKLQSDSNLLALADAWAALDALETRDTNYVGFMSYKRDRNGPRSRQESVKPSLGEAGAGAVDMSCGRFMWDLVRLRLLTPRNFICPASNDYPAEGSSTAGGQLSPPELYDFDGWRTCSYGMQVPLGRNGKVLCNIFSSSLPLFADKGPWSQAAEEGPGGPPKLSRAQSVNQQDWTPFNSPNHGGAGQNVLSMGGTGTWVSKPIVGAKGDNIYTAWDLSEPNPTSRVEYGIAPDRDKNRGLTSQGDTDTLIYP